MSLLKRLLKSSYFGWYPFGLIYRLPWFSVTAGNCPVCDGDQPVYESRNKCTDLVRCPVCDHVFAQRMPTLRTLGIWYGDSSYWTLDKRHQGISNPGYSPEWDDFVDARLNILARVGMLGSETPKMRIFEIGCSEGMLLHHLNKMGHEACGCEINEEIAAIGRQANGVEIHSGSFETLDLEKAAYDLIISFHTVEHLIDVKTVFSKIQGLLRPEGAVLIEVPSGPEEYDNVEHLQFFSGKSLKILLEGFFQRVKIYENKYVTAKGTTIASLYGFGKYPIPESQGLPHSSGDGRCRA